MSCNNSILHLIPQFKVCEIGVRRGDSTLEFLKRGCFVFAIDPWEDYSDYNEKNYDYDSDYKETMEKIKDFKSYQIIRKKSDDALLDVPDDLDLVYIDGNHQYEFVKNDIDNYWEKLKSGGFLTGDDYSMQGPQDAVNDFLKNNPNLRMELFQNNWVIRKI